jgi:hypothetical protein
MRSVASAAVASSVLVASSFAQNPVPQIVGPVHPDAVAPGGGDFTLSVYGANFVPGSVVNWNYQPRTTIYISAHEIQAQILASDVKTNTAGFISVTNPPPGGGESSASWAQVEVHDPISTISVRAPKEYFIATPTPADFTHSGRLSLLGEYGSALILDKNLGNGTFRFSSQAGKFYDPYAQFAYGDFNGDGNIDAVFVQGSYFIPNDHMEVWLGDGTGKFSAGPQVTAFGTFGLVAVGDFNQDGKLDLFTGGERTEAMFLGNGDGTFQHVANYPLVSLPTEMVAGDFNNDGKLDAVFLQIVGGEPPSLMISFVAGNGDGTFQNPKQIYTSSTVGCAGTTGFQGVLQVSDFNNDGNLDIAFCNFLGQIGVMLGNGDGTFQAPIFTNTNAANLFSYAIGDINSDGKQDLIICNFYDSTTQAVIYLGNGNGTFQQSQSINALGGNLGITVGDLNSDGLLDYVFVDDLGAEVYIQQ